MKCIAPIYSTYAAPWWGRTWTLLHGYWRVPIKLFFLEYTGICLHIGWTSLWASDLMHFLGLTSFLYCCQGAACRGLLLPADVKGICIAWLLWPCFLCTLLPKKGTSTFYPVDHGKNEQSIPGVHDLLLCSISSKLGTWIPKGLGYSRYNCQIWGVHRMSSIINAQGKAKRTAGVLLRVGELCCVKGNGKLYCSVLVLSNLICVVIFILLCLHS